MPLSVASNGEAARFTQIIALAIAGKRAHTDWRGSNGDGGNPKNGPRPSERSPLLYISTRTHYSLLC